MRTHTLNQKTIQRNTSSDKTSCGHIQGQSSNVCSLLQSHRGEAPYIQPALTVSDSGDRFEQEAGRIADLVASGSSDTDSEHRNESPLIPRHEVNACLNSNATQDLQPSESKGTPLSGPMRSEYESMFGHNLGNVRIHTDADAIESAKTMGAKAMTIGNDILFGNNQYSPETQTGRHLLSHELVHAVQQRNISDAGILQRVPITGTRNSTSIYELQQVRNSRRQVQSGRSMTGINMALSYDPATHVFSVTFPLVWSFPHTWDNTRRRNYVTAFTTSVRGVWNNKYTLNETQAPRRSANVDIQFDNHVILQMTDALEEQMQLMNPAVRGRWRMNVHNSNIRDSVNRRLTRVNLGTGSNQRAARRARDLRRGRSYVVSGTGGNRTFRQAAAPHEFGHMIGLGDEYLEDVDNERVPRAVRGYINNRIMNVGENVTPDAYAPFAEWISGLTGTTWRVGNRVP